MPEHDCETHDQLRQNRERWDALPFVGIQHSPGHFDYVLELRNCTCGSTLGRRVQKGVHMVTNDAAVPLVVADEVERPPYPHAVPDATPRQRIQTRPTVRLDVRDLKPSWPVAIASLDQIAPWAGLALRLGTLALIQAVACELAEPDASADLVVRLRVLTDALAHMPFDA